MTTPLIVGVLSGQLAAGVQIVSLPVSALTLIQAAALEPGEAIIVGGNSPDAQTAFVATQAAVNDVAIAVAPFTPVEIIRSGSLILDPQWDNALSSGAGGNVGITGQPIKVDPTVPGTYPNAPTIVAAANADTALLAANAARRGCIVSNDSPFKLYVLLDQSGAGAASAALFSYVIAPGAVFEMPTPVFLGRIRGFWPAGATGNAAVTDIT